MDEQNKTPAPEQANSAKKPNRHKRHHGKHRHNGQRPDGAAVNQPQQKHDGQQPQTNQNQAPTAQKQRDGQQGNAHGQKKNGRRQNGGDQRKKKHRNGGNINTRRGPEDLYGHPTEDDVLTMDELRAKIVVKSADGSTPQATKAPVSDFEQNAEKVSTNADDLLIPMDADPAPADPAEESVEVVGIRFRTSGKVYYFSPKRIKLRRGQYAIVETARGPEFGEVSFGNRFVKKSSTVSPLRPVLRAATEADIARNLENIKKEEESLEICRKKIAEHRLQMKLIDVQYAFDGSKILFYFTSEGRVDFRELVKDLASVFRTRIELRQIGIRDEAKLLGGLGTCGRPLCCATFLSDFVQVSIKMAKEQGISLNSSKISGVCGRLMCCLRYESDVYAEEIRRTPPLDSTVNTPDGVGTVIGMSPLAGTVRVLLKNTPDTPPKQYRREEVSVLGREKNTKAEQE